MSYILYLKKQKGIIKYFKLNIFKNYISQQLKNK